MIHDIEKIIEDGIKAPSGENCQPWKFSVEEDKLSIFNVPEADLSLYNSLQRGSYIAHGALIENISISASQHGYHTSVSLFPNKENDVHVADIFFKKVSIVIHPLYDAINERCTNRKDYTGEKLNMSERKKLISSVSLLSHNTLVILDDTQKLKQVGVALAVHEKVLFENKKMHDFFYDHIIWDKKDERKAGGFYIDTLEFLPHQLKAVKLLKYWFLLSILNVVLQISTMISKENGEKYAQSGLFGALTMKGTSNEEYIYLGMSMERLWLTATNLGIAMHPCNGTLYLMQHINNGKEEEFSEKHSKIIRSSYKEIIEAFNYNENGTIGFIFRIGKGEGPTARAKRLSPRIDYITKQ